MSTEILNSAEAAQLEQSFVVGLSRSPLPPLNGLEGAANLPLAALALLGQRKRFRPPVPVAANAQPVLPEDSRQIMPNAARRYLRQLVTMPRTIASDAVPTAVFDAVLGRGRRFHPFDLHWLEGYLKALPEYCRLGPSEAAWLARSSGQSTSRELADDIDDDDWTRFSKAARTAYLRRRRAMDPPAARELLMAVFGEEPAGLRAELLACLEVGLGPGDCAFLEQLSSDRAKSVRDVAAGLIAQIPGTPSYAARCEAALAEMEITSKGLVSRKKQLRFRRRAKDQRPEHRQRQVRQMLAGIRIDDITARFGLEAGALLPAADADHALLTVLLEAAAREGRWTLVFEFAESGQAGWDFLLQAAADGLMALSETNRRDTALEIVKRAGFVVLERPDSLQLLYDLVSGPLDELVADALLGSKAWRTVVEGRGSDLCIPAVAPLIPSSHRQRFLADIEPLPHELNRWPTLYHRFVAALDSRSSSEKQDIAP